jgi:hypothetical protein
MLGCWQRQRRSLCTAHVVGDAGQSWGGGSGAFFACVTWLALIGDGRVLVLCISGGCRGVSGGALVGQWRSHSVDAGMLVSEEKGPNNHHEVEGVEGRQRGEH